MLDADTRLDPMTLKEKQPEQYQRFMDCLRKDGPEYADLIENDPFVQTAIKRCNARIKLRLGNLPASAQAVIKEATEHAQQQREARNAKA